MNDPLSKLPLFATDDEIAIAIVGRKRASEWKRGALKILEARGFPAVDLLHGGRPVPLIRKWYEIHMGIDKSYVMSTLEDGKENLDALRGKRQLRNDRRPQLGLDGRSQKVLLYMAAHPDAQTHPAIPNAGPSVMVWLAGKGVITAEGKDWDGDTVWQVTEAGHDEAKRIDWYYNGRTRP
ncbi:hypothetical protein [Neorhizobium sp. SOG26]|uniref:hypothetical protein n=1 Tax=Neorhizobium sp. SOG26 TaxID=2060726 RepID=UPI0018FF6FCA|nr:hypothetical protein [Neorhizobium sp. SOG26]